MRGSSREKKSVAAVGAGAGQELKKTMASGVESGGRGQEGARLWMSVPGD